MHNYCGGVLFNGDGAATRVSFFFEKDSHVYGVTAGHLANLEDTVFAFCRFGDEDVCETVPFGKVVSHDTETDSLIFRVAPDKKDMVYLLKQAPKVGMGNRPLQLPAPCANPTPPEEGSDIVSFDRLTDNGTSRTGTVTICSNPDRGRHSLIGDIGIQSKESGGITTFTEAGDSGALYLDKKGVPIAIHHAIRGEMRGKRAQFCSFAVPVAKIMSKHPLLGGTAAVRPPKVKQSARTTHLVESLDIAHFRIKIVGQENYADISHSLWRCISHFLWRCIFHFLWPYISHFLLCIDKMTILVTRNLLPAPQPSGVPGLQALQIDYDDFYT